MFPGRRPACDLKARELAAILGISVTVPILAVVVGLFLGKQADRNPTSSVLGRVGLEYVMKKLADRDNNGIVTKQELDTMFLDNFDADYDAVIRDCNQILNPPARYRHYLERLVDNALASRPEAIEYAREARILSDAQLYSGMPRE